MNGNPRRDGGGTRDTKGRPAGRVRAGREVVVLDAFCDRDTGAVAQCIDVADHTGAALDPERVHFFDEKSGAAI